MIVHGGPHGAILPNFSALRSALLSLNYNLLLVNFRGSIGFGDKVLRELPGNIGTMDLADVLDGLDLASNYVSIENTIVYGGSHGGFLGGHLVADERIKGGILLNGVYNCASMGLVTDIPDWVYYEGLGVDT